MVLPLGLIFELAMHCLVIEKAQITVAVVTQARKTANWIEKQVSGVGVIGQMQKSV